MKRKARLLTALLCMVICLASLCFGSCQAESIRSDPETLYQVALLQSLAQGHYDGIITIGELKEHGDTGIGTFDGVNGEMIVLDGVVYQAIYDGSIVLPPDEEKIPFGNVTFFEADAALELPDIPDMTALQEQLNAFVSGHGANLFYMVKIAAEFPAIKVRSEYKQEKPYRELDVALAADQVEWDLEHVFGTMIGLYCPSFMGGLNTAGWHFHFITEDLKRGGHVLEVSLKSTTALFDTTPGFALSLPDADEGFQNMDLSRNMDEAIHRAETATSEDLRPEPDEPAGKPVKTGIIGAMDEEVASLKEALENEKTTRIAGMEFSEGILDGQDVVIVKCGVGKVNAGACTQLLISLFQADRVINTGVAGSLDAKIDIGDIVVSTDAVQHDFDLTPLGYAPGELDEIGVQFLPADAEMREKAVNAVGQCAPEVHVFEGRVCTGDQFISSAEQKEDILAEFGGLCCEMEGGAIAQICYQNGVPFVIIRAISDKADGSAEMAYVEFEKAAAARCAAITRYMIAH